MTSTKTAQGPYVKVAFEVEDEEDPDRVEVETMWALPVESGYKVDNIPFFAYGVAWGDIVEAVPGDGGVLEFTGIVSPSGHSVVRLWFDDARNVQATRDALRAMGCGSELMGTRLVAVDIPASIDYVEIAEVLSKWHEEGLFDYEEACLGQRSEDQ